MKLLGLTGGVAMGKSTVADLLAERGIAVVDTDLLARQLVEPGAPALSEIVEAFGSRFLDQSGRLRRGDLAQLVFGDQAARRRLEGILHPRIRSAWRRQVESWRAAGAPIALVVIPLLFETEAEGDFDLVLCAACSRESQRRRLEARGWSPQQSEARLESQWPVGLKMDRSDLVIWTEGTLEITRRQLDRAFRQFNLHPSIPSVRICAEKLVP